LDAPRLSRPSTADGKNDAERRAFRSHAERGNETLFSRTVADHAEHGFAAVERRGFGAKQPRCQRARRIARSFRSRAKPTIRWRGACRADYTAWFGGIGPRWPPMCIFVHYNVLAAFDLQLFSRKCA